jgi:hypothetical protein
MTTKKPFRFYGVLSYSLGYFLPLVALFATKPVLFTVFKTNPAVVVTFILYILFYLYSVFQRIKKINQKETLSVTKIPDPKCNFYIMHLVLPTDQHISDQTDQK